MDDVVAFPELTRPSNKSKARKLKFTEAKLET
jgi:hypothetical protein